MCLSKIDGKIEWTKHSYKDDYGKYLGEFEKLIPNDQGTYTFIDCKKYIGNGRTVNTMVKEHSLDLMEQSISENTRMG